MSEATATAFGIVAEFDSAATAVAAAHRLGDEGWQCWDVYGPAPLEELEALVPPREGRTVTTIMVVAGLLGAAAGYLLQYWNAVYSYPLNVGGRPNGGGPGFIPSAWEICALCAVWGGLIAFLAGRRLPRLHHPLFAAAQFERASQDRFFICVERRDPAYDAARLRGIFQQHGAASIAEVPE